VGELSWGLAARMFRHLELAYNHVNRTDQFHGQQGGDRFGSLMVKLLFMF
jgi:hypothetical protein